MGKSPNTARCDRRRWCKAEARRRLGERDNLFTLIIAALALILITVSLTVVVDGLFAFLDFGLISPDPPAEAAVSAVRIFLLVLGVLFLLFPLWYGLRGIALSAMRGEPCSAGQLFWAFDTPRAFRRVCFAALLMLWRFGLSFALFWGMWYGVGLAAVPLRWFLLPAAVLLTPLLLFPLAGTHLLFPLMLIRPELGAFAALRLSTRLSVRSLGETLLFWGSFAGWFALAFVSGGVMLVLFVLPYFILADTAYVQYLLARAAMPITISTEEKNHVQ